MSSVSTSTPTSGEAELQKYVAVGNINIKVLLVTNGPETLVRVRYIEVGNS